MVCVHSDACVSLIGDRLVGMCTQREWTASPRLSSECGVERHYDGASCGSRASAKEHIQECAVAPKGVCRWRHLVRFLGLVDRVHRGVLGLSPASTSISGLSGWIAPLRQSALYGQTCHFPPHPTHKLPSRKEGIAGKQICSSHSFLQHHATLASVWTIRQPIPLSIFRGSCQKQF